MCPNCRHPNPVGSKFCNNCGHSLSAASLSPPLPDSSASPPAPAPVPVASGEDVEGERRNMTMLFCDVQGSTAASEKLDPEDWTEVMNGVFGYMIRPVYRYEGTVARLMGDAILAFFGAPVTHEDDPQRAVLAGLEIVEGFKAYREHVVQKWGIDINLRVGVNTGLVVVGAVGAGQRTEYTAMGDAINVAARMEQTAQAGTVQIAEDTYRMVAPFFEVHELGGVLVKGKSEPVPSYRVLRQKLTPSRVRGIEGLETPLVGRDQEMTTLRRAVNKLRQGRGQIVCLIGEAGLGKSRLLEELRLDWLAALTAQGSAAGWDHWSTMGAVSYGTGDPYGMIKHQIRQNCKVQLGDPAQVVRRKIAEGYSEYPQSVKSRLQRAYAQLLGAQPDDGSLPPLAGEDLKRELITSTVEAFAAQIGDQPTVYAFDDVHWADAASVELLQQLLQLADTLPVMLLCTMRPYREAPGWEIKVTAERDHPHHYTELTLRPLKVEDGEALVDGLLAVPELPQALRNTLLAKAEGNPFFLEEVVRTLIDQGILVPDTAHREQGSARAAASATPGRTNGRTRWRVAADVDAADIAIPDNVRALLTSRIDRLDEECRHTLQLASVIGRSFFYRVLEAVAQPIHDLTGQLSTLQRLDLVRELRRVPELEFSFRHALTRDAAYSSILRRRRRQFHGRVGEAMEKLYAEQLEEHAAELAHHFTEARDDERAMRYFAIAGEEAARVFANAEAILHYRRALALSEKQRVSSKELTDLYTRLGRALELDAQFDRALAVYEDMESLARERGDRVMELTSLMARVTVQAVPNAYHDADRAEQLGDRALGLARELGDRVAETRILWSMSVVYYFGYRLDQAIDCGERSLALARELDLCEQIAQTLNGLGSFCYLYSGRIDQAKAALREASDLWRDLGNLPMLADSLSSASVAHYYAGEYERAIALAREALQISESINNSWGQSYSKWMVGGAFWERGEPSRAIGVMEESIRLSQLANFVVPQAYTRADLAAVYGDLGAVRLGLETAELALSISETQMPVLRAHTLGILAHLNILDGNLTEAEAAIDAGYKEPSREAWSVYFVPVPLADAELAIKKGDYERAMAVTNALLSSLREYGMRSQIPYVLYMQGQALLGLGEDEAARQRLLESCSEAQAIGSRRTLWHALSALSRLAADQREAQQLRREARQVVDYIADHIDQADLRRSFLNRPDVQVVKPVDPLR
jgi:class 3 adenylate cyclase/tetratricopeptide (TPR) repeat protein